MRIPEKINQGDSISWNDVPATDNMGEEISVNTGWTLNYAIRGASSLDLVSEDDGSEWLTSMTSAQSAALAAGFFYWQAFATKGSDRRTLGSGRVEIIKNLALVTGTYDGRSQARQDLDAVQASIRALVSGGAVQEYTIGNRSMRKMNLADLYIIESKLKYQVAQEERAEKIKSGLGDPRNLFVRFR
jgi:hypothetical protein